MPEPERGSYLHRDTKEGQSAIRRKQEIPLQFVAKIDDICDKSYLVLAKQSIHSNVIGRIMRAKRGTIFFPGDFVAMGDDKAVGKVLERLAASGTIVRVARGIYVRPAISAVTGNALLPSIDELATAIARRDKAKVLPTGAYAQYKLGLTTQVPMNVVYHTNASARKVRVGLRVITFRSTSARNLYYKGPISSLAIQALLAYGKEGVAPEVLAAVQSQLAQEDPKLLQHDILLAPAWVRRLLSPPYNKTP